MAVIAGERNSCEQFLMVLSICYEKTYNMATRCLRKRLDMSVRLSRNDRKRSAIKDIPNKDIK